MKISFRAFMSVVCAGVLIFLPKEGKADTIDPMVEEYVKQIVVHSYLGKISDVTRQVVIQHNIDIVPQFAQSAIYQVGFEAFKNSPVIGDVIRAAYEDGIAIAKEAHQSQSQSAEIDIKKAVDAHIDPMIDDPIFRRIIETVINQTLSQQRAIMLQANAQRQIQEMVVRQKVMEEAIKRQFEEAYKQAYTQSYKEQLNSSGVFSSN